MDEGISFLEFIYMNLHDTKLYIFSIFIILSFRLICDIIYYLYRFIWYDLNKTRRHVSSDKLLCRTAFNNTAGWFLALLESYYAISDIDYINYLFRCIQFLVPFKT